jgi:serine/threonine protein phosphatase PrpC
MRDRVQPPSEGTSLRDDGNDDGAAKEDETKVQVLSMDDFNSMMDTLSQQPSAARAHGKRATRAIASVASDSEGEEEASDSPVVKPMSLKAMDLVPQLKNRANGLGAAFYSDKGIRDHNEDKLALVVDLADFYVREVHGGGVGGGGHGGDAVVNSLLEDHSLDADAVDAMHKITMPCLFDGHSGDTCSEYLSRHVPRLLASHKKLLDKTPEAALHDVCREVDGNVCDYLFEKEDISGSTGLIVLYDGRRSVLTVANVGDSMCVLSRAGRAIKMHRQHRLNDEAERQRVEAAGGQVLKNRVHGVLAVSRAFGDTRFKDGDGDAGAGTGKGGLTCGPVIAVPDVYSEVCTPHTEFCVVATDGLWDVMTPQQAVNFVRTKLSKKVELQTCARDLAQEATKKRGSVDNVTVILLVFHLGSGPSAH